MDLDCNPDTKMNVDDGEVRNETRESEHNNQHNSISAPLLRNHVGDAAAGEDDDDEVQIVGPPPPTDHHPSSVPSSSVPNKLSQKEMRRKNRRRMFRLLKNPNVTPSFLRLIGAGQSNPTKGGEFKKDQDNTEDDDDDDDGDFLLAPPMVVIDVDEYLGLKKRKFPDPIESTTSNGIYSATRTATLSSRQKQQSSRLVPHTTISSSLQPTTVTAVKTNYNPADDGWYEGVLPMTLPEDDTYLTDIQRWVRQNLEYFSATEQDSLMNQAGRRTPTVRGKVGIRCIHCAKVIKERLQQNALNPPEQGGENTKISWPAGSVSYPLNISGLYSGAIQKPQLHFENCPNMPPDSRLTELLARSRASQLGTATGSGGSHAAGTKRKRMKEGMSALLYWTVSCHRIGLVEMAGNGLRFGRDLSLDPLPFQATRTRVEQEHPELVPKPAQTGLGSPTKFSGSGVSLAPDRIQSLIASNTEGEHPSTPINLPKDVSDVLNEAKKEEDDPTKLLARQVDQYGLSSFMFLAVKQAAICHASKQDFATRGKKTKLMRVGFTGFCCRHCKKNYPTDNGIANQVTSGVDIPGFQYSCRSFSSSHENLASAMSNSFVLHLLKCVYTPRPIKHALQTLKRMHQRQMQQLPYGSQSRVFTQMWERARAADRIAATSETIVDNDNDNDHILEGGTSDVDDAPEDGDDAEFLPDDRDSPQSDTDVEISAVPNRVASSSARTHARSRRPESQHISSPGPLVVSATIPVVDDEETRDLLKQFETKWDPDENDGLILPEDRCLISDYVFLCMRQLKVAHPTLADFKGNRRNNVLSRMAGICCIHCSTNQHHQFIKPSGRSFPSAPDNLASALNSSLYNHMLNCPGLPAPVRRAMQVVRKIHSIQCSSLPFGSQRRYFNRLYARLQKVSVEPVEVVTIQDPPAVGGKGAMDDSVQMYAFLHRTGSGGAGTSEAQEYWQCQNCRMVPFDYRASGSLHFECPKVETMKRHFETCKKDSMIWDSIHDSLTQLEGKYGAGLGQRESFQSLVRTVVGNIALDGVMAILKEAGNSPTPNGGSLWREMPTKVDFCEVESAFSSLGKELQLDSNKLNDHPDMLRFLQLLSCNLQVPLPINADGSSNNPELLDEAPSYSRTKSETT